MGSNPNQNWTPPPVPGQPPIAEPDDSSGGGFDWSWLTTTSGGDAAPGPYQTEPTAQTFQQIGGFLSHLWAQLTYTSPEDQLTSIIADKMGLGNYNNRDPQQNRQRQLILQEARVAAHQAMTDANYRAELAQSLGWNQSNAQVAAWIKNGGQQLPQNPFGTTTVAPPGGVPAQQQRTPPGAIAAPFDYHKWEKGGGYQFGDLLAPQFAAASGLTHEEGNDYDIPLGTQLFSPFSGTIIEADYNGSYGNTVVVRMANGVTFRMSHLESLNVQKGQAASPGMLLGLSGSTGDSSGPHVDIEMKDPQGHPIDPRPVIDPLLAPNADLTATGQPYQKLTDLNSMVAGESGPFLTPDGHWVYPGSQDFNVYAAAQGLWKQRYGGDPPWSFVSGLIAQGNTTREQIQSAMDQMTSDIGGMNWGQRDAFASNVNNATIKAWNRPVPDATLKDLAKLGITDPGGIAGWINSHPANALDPATYGTYFDQLNNRTQDLWQQPPSPDLIAHIHKQMQQGPQ